MCSASGTASGLLLGILMLPCYALDHPCWVASHDRVWLHILQPQIDNASLSCTQVRLYSALVHTLHAPSTGTFVTTLPAPIAQPYTHGKGSHMEDS